MTTNGDNYPNPLDKFRTYSYHYVMSVAGNTETFRKMVDDGGRSMLAAVSSVKIGEAFKVGTSSQAYLVLDTRRFSQFSLTDLEMDHTFGGGSIHNPSIPVNSTTIKITDTTGFSFFNMLMEIFRDRLQTSRTSAFFMLSVIFSGHKDDGTVEHVSTCHIPLSLLSMEFTFASAGCQYELQMMEIVGSPQRSYRQADVLCAVNSISTENWSSNTVGSMLDDLEQQLNIQSLEFYQKFNKKSNTTARAAGKLVQYMITVPCSADNNWRDMKITTASRSYNIEQTFNVMAATNPGTAALPAAARAPTAQLNTLSGARANYSQLTFTNTTTITDAIKAVLESSDEFLSLASTERRLAGQAQIFRIVTSITSDDNSLVVHFDVLPHWLPKLTKKDDKNTASVIAPGQSVKNVVGPRRAVKNLITYDYIFTGKNSHIRDLKIHFGPNADVALDTNLQLGRARLASVAASGQKTAAVTAASQGAKKTTTFSPLIRDSDPIFPSLRSRDEQSNNSTQKNEYLTKEQAAENFKQKQEYNQTIAYMHFLGSLQLDMEVRGNPNIIRKFADKNSGQSFPPHVQLITGDALTSVIRGGSAADNFKNFVGGGVRSAKQQYINTYISPKISAIRNPNVDSDALDNGVDPATLPIFVKLNIQAPNTDIAGNPLKDQPLYTNSFFYNGYYQLLSTRTVLNNGQFGHTMCLVPYDPDGSFTQS